METLIKQIAVKAYLNKGQPCCAANFKTGEVCIFYRTSKLGFIENCVFSDGPLSRRGDGHGTLIPCEKCIIWGAKE